MDRAYPLSHTQLLAGHWKTPAYTALALLAFAANSVLNRMALGGGLMDAAGFATLRLASGAAMLMLLLAIRTKHQAPRSKGSWVSSLLLFGYAAAFSFAYMSLTTATGALLLFGAVQLTMIASVLWLGQALRMAEWTGVILAVVGFIVLLLPGLTAPPVTGALLMALAGYCWGRYSLRGHHAGDALADTAWNFLRSLLWVVLLLLATLDHSRITVSGIVLAVISGAIMSGIGYAI